MRITRLIPIAFVLLAIAAATAAAPMPAQPQAGVWQTMGEYRITGYCPCAKCCGKSDGITADGTYAPGSPDRLVSAPKDIPFGTKLWIEGVGVAVVHDRGGAIKGRRLELFFHKHKEALGWGVEHRQVWRWTEK